MQEHQIMTLEEVAEYLRVSERTVYDWANRGEIPCGKFGTAWRFKRSDIERWVDERLGNRHGLRNETVAIRDVLAPERVLLLETKRKAEALIALIDVLAQTPQVRNREELEREMFERERLLSTGIGFGIGIPHVRLASVTDLVMAVALAREPLSDYQSLDDEPVRLIFMIAARKDQHARYLKILAAISSLIKVDFIRRSLLEAQDAQMVFHFLTETH